MIPERGVWSAAWTRALYFSQIPAIFHDRIYYIDKLCENGRQRDWFVEVWFQRKAIPVWLMSQSFQTSGTSVTLSSLTPAWNNANNFVEGVGAGASGAASQQNATGQGTGGGGGEYRKIANFTDPGGATSMQIGQGGPAKQCVLAGGAQSLNGADGTDTLWDTTSLIAKGGKGGVAANGGTPSGGAGGTGGTGAAANNDGGRGGNVGAALKIATGGGGAGGPNGVGGNGQDRSTGGASTGGQGDGASGGTGGAGGTTGTNGNPGIELDTTGHTVGCGGGGGSGTTSGTNAAITGGSGGLYGGAGGGAINSGSGNNSSNQVTSGAGKNGIIVLTWTAAVSFTFFNLIDLAYPDFRKYEIVGY